MDRRQRLEFITAARALHILSEPNPYQCDDERNELANILQAICSQALLMPVEQSSLVTIVLTEAIGAAMASPSRIQTLSLCTDHLLKTLETLLVQLGSNRHELYPIARLLMKTRAQIPELEVISLLIISILSPHCATSDCSIDEALPLSDNIIEAVVEDYLCYETPKELLLAEAGISILQSAVSFGQEMPQFVIMQLLQLLKTIEGTDSFELRHSIGDLIGAIHCNGQSLGREALRLFVEMDPKVAVAVRSAAVDVLVTETSSVQQGLFHAALQAFTTPQGKIAPLMFEIWRITSIDQQTILFTSLFEYYQNLGSEKASKHRMADFPLRLIAFARAVDRVGNMKLEHETVQFAMQAMCTCEDALGLFLTPCPKLSDEMLTTLMHTLFRIYLTDEELGSNLPSKIPFHLALNCLESTIQADDNSLCDIFSDFSFENLDLNIPALSSIMQALINSKYEYILPFNIITRCCSLLDDDRAFGMLIKLASTIENRFFSLMSIPKYWRFYALALPLWATQHSLPHNSFDLTFTLLKQLLAEEHSQDIADHGLSLLDSLLSCGSYSLDNMRLYVDYLQQSFGSSISISLSHLFLRHFGSEELLFTLVQCNEFDEEDLVLFTSINESFDIILSDWISSVIKDDPISLLRYQPLFSIGALQSIFVPSRLELLKAILVQNPKHIDPCHFESLFIQISSEISNSICVFQGIVSDLELFGLLPSLTDSTQLAFAQDPLLAFALIQSFTALVEYNRHEISQIISNSGDASPAQRYIMIFILKTILSTAELKEVVRCSPSDTTDLAAAIRFSLDTRTIPPITPFQQSLFAIQRSSRADVSSLDNIPPPLASFVTPMFEPHTEQFNTLVRSCLQSSHGAVALLKASAKLPMDNFAQLVTVLLPLFSEQPLQHMSGWITPICLPCQAQFRGYLETIVILMQFLEEPSSRVQCDFACNCLLTLTDPHICKFSIETSRATKKTVTRLLQHLVSHSFSNDSDYRFVSAVLMLALRIEVSKESDIFARIFADDSPFMEAVCQLVSSESRSDNENLFLSILLLHYTNDIRASHAFALAPWKTLLASKFGITLRANAVSDIVAWFGDETEGLSIFVISKRRFVVRCTSEDQSTSVTVHLKDTWPLRPASITVDSGSPDITLHVTKAVTMIQNISPRKLPLLSPIYTCHSLLSAVAAINTIHSQHMSTIMEQGPCLICFQVFLEGYAPDKTCSVCNTPFHSKCFAHWRLVSQSASCPHCRSIDTIQ